MKNVVTIRPATKVGELEGAEGGEKRPQSPSSLQSSSVNRRWRKTFLITRLATKAEERKVKVKNVHTHVQLVKEAMKAIKARRALAVLTHTRVVVPHQKPHLSNLAMVLLNQNLNRTCEPHCPLSFKALNVDFTR